MYDALLWLESSALGHLMRESGAWTYAAVNLAHLLGVATLFGAVLITDLRLMGVWPQTPLGALASATDPLAVTGFTLAAVSGVGLLASNATEYAGNPFLLAKFPAIAIGLVNVFVLRRSAGWRARNAGGASPRDRRRLAAMGAISLASWLTAVSAGRMIGYW